ncbi:hypothetical protein T10_8640 [Trichinella papuae]|uniref:Uncharacterized protein n=1 Tax=Trichinella papuae TaxID=268474 RepID=A0A0V1ML18_9BILA|nr:hypothetical protein T10_8640 [Trichinella papuae]
MFIENFANNVTYLGRAELLRGILREENERMTLCLLHISKLKVSTMLKNICLMGDYSNHQPLIRLRFSVKVSMRKLFGSENI